MTQDIFQFSSTPLDQLPEWHAFSKAAGQGKVNRNQLNILNAAGIQVDLSTQLRSPEQQDAAQRLLEARHFEAARVALIDGHPFLNTTEKRAAWHTQLRRPRVDNAVREEHHRVQEFVRRADSERRWRNVIHIGIGGSDWGVRLATSAFGSAPVWRTVRFVSSIDGHSIKSALAGLDPRETLIVVATKSFTTTETISNAKVAIKWLQNAKIDNPFNQVVAITAKPERALEWGVPRHNIFRFWEWVGGRFSIWSALGLTAGLIAGLPVLAGLQSGAHAMDMHFLTAPFAENVPLQMALCAVTNRSVGGYGSHNIAVYDSRLSQLVPYLQQLEMESLGKSVDHYGQPINVPTGPVIWGMPGTDAQHTFFQWLHQGSDGAPIDFIVSRKADHDWHNHHRELLSHCLAQREALWSGKTEEQAYQENIQSGMEESEARLLAKHRALPGGRPSSLIVLPRLTPFFLGALLAMYEHKVFVQGLIWGLNPFDQWGVELGKVLASNIEAEIDGRSAKGNAHDASTAHWIEDFKRMMDETKSEG